MATTTQYINEKMAIVPYWLNLLAIAAAELLTVFFNLTAGLICHSLLLVVFIVQTAVAIDRQQRNLYMALCLAPLIRILSLIMPLAPLAQVYWYPLIYVPLLAATIAVVVNTGLRMKDIGLVSKGLFLQIMFGVITGICLGALEYVILRPIPLAAHLTVNEVWFPALILIVTTGLVEELIFRGVLQSLAERLMGSWNILYVSILFAVLHFGHYSLLDVAFVFVVAVFFAFVVKKTGSLVGVILSHGIANAVLYTIAPYILA